MVVHIYSGILLSHKKEQNNAICSNMNGLRDCHMSEVSQGEKDKIPYDSTYMCNLKKNEINELVYKTEVLVTDVENKLMVTRELGEGINWEIEIDVYTLVYIKEITDKDLELPLRLRW